MNLNGMVSLTEATMLEPMTFRERLGKMLRFWKWIPLWWKFRSYERAKNKILHDDMLDSWNYWLLSSLLDAFEGTKPGYFRVPRPRFDIDWSKRDA